MNLSGSIDSLLCWLKQETESYQVVIAGSSAGGYLALAICNALKCRCAVTFGAQINLYNHNDAVTRCKLLARHKESKTYSKWYDLSNLLKKNKVPILFFYSDKCSMDVRQLQYAKNCPGVTPIPIGSSEHAVTLNKEALTALFANVFEPLLWEVMNEYSVKALNGNSKDSDGLSKMLLDRLGIYSVENNFNDGLMHVQPRYNVIRDIELIQKIGDKDIIIYGAGKVGSQVIDYLSRYKNCYVFDKDAGKVIRYKNKITESELKVLIHKGKMVIITVQDSQTFTEIYQWLIKCLKGRSSQIIKYCSQ